MHAELGAALVLAKPVLILSETEPRFSLFYHHVLARRFTGNFMARLGKAARFLRDSP